MNHGNEIYFVLALHNHQPVGNLCEVFKSSFEQTYEPFIAVLERFPGIKAVLHYSGSLLDWLAANEPSFINRLSALAAAGQVEILGGGYYEPILPSIPDQDKVGQINFLSERLEELFRVRPQGLWLAERVWEPHLALPIAEAGLEFTAVDDTHFQDAGIDELDHYYRTEEAGAALDIFPINEELRYLVPFKPAHETIDFLSDRRAENKPRLFVLADDGEKFGGWPGTHEAVYEKGWLEQFFSLLEEQRDWLKMVTFSEYRVLFPPRGPVYLPTGSYREMKEWSGGFWRNFYHRYPESNRMHKKMLAVRRRLHELPASEGSFAEAQKRLWAGQCNCAYWHGVFGGLYLNFLRAAVWENLLHAERIADEALEKGPFLMISEEDRSYSGEQAIVLNSDRFSLLFSPAQGGSLWEFSWRPAAVNFLDTLTRRPEAYHQEYLNQAAAPPPESEGEVDSIHNRKVLKEEGILEHLVYDPYPRGALIEHFLEKTVTLKDFSKGKQVELGDDFLLKPAEVHIERLSGPEHDGAEGVKLSFHRAGIHRDGIALLLEKVITLFAGEDRLQVDYALTNRSRKEAALSFAVEFNLAFLGGYDEGRYYRVPGRELREAHLASAGSEKEVDEFTLVDRWRNLALSFAFDRPALLWRMPVETISLSEGGLERTYQQSLLLPRWDLTIGPGERQAIGLSLQLARVSADDGAETAAAPPDQAKGCAAKV
ncbi:MAG: alpha-amylase/4-alpha-glucanotransferase domain-containing protein [Bacillota bacterium]